MGHSLIITAYSDENSHEYFKHKKVLLACFEAGIKLLPKETADFFGYKNVDKSLLEEPLKRPLNMTEYKTDYSEGYEINTKEIPSDVTKLRIVISH